MAAAVKKEYHRVSKKVNPNHSLEEAFVSGTKSRQASYPSSLTVAKGAQFCRPVNNKLILTAKKISLLEQLIELSHPPVSDEICRWRWRSPLRRSCAALLLFVAFLPRRMGLRSYAAQSVCPGICPFVRRIAPVTKLPYPLPAFLLALAHLASQSNSRQYCGVPAKCFFCFFCLLIGAFVIIEKRAWDGVDPGTYMPCWAFHLHEKELRLKLR